MCSAYGLGPTRRRHAVMAGEAQTGQRLRVTGSGVSTPGAAPHPRSRQTGCAPSKHNLGHSCGMRLGEHGAEPRVRRVSPFLHEFIAAENRCMLPQPRLSNNVDKALVALLLGDSGKELLV